MARSCVRVLGSLTIVSHTSRCCNTNVCQESLKKCANAHSVPAMSTETLPTRRTNQHVATEAKVLDLIDTLRAEHHACTMKQVSNHGRLTETLLRNLLHSMRRRNLVTWTAMPGSLRTVRSAAPTTDPDTGQTLAKPAIDQQPDGTVVLTWDDECQHALISHQRLSSMVEAHNAHVLELAELTAELERVTFERDAAREILDRAPVTAKNDPQQESPSRGVKSAAARAKRPPTPAELAARARLQAGAEAARERKRQEREASAGTASPQGDSDAGAEGHEEKLEPAALGKDAHEHVSVPVSPS